MREQFNFGTQIRRRLVRAILYLCSAVVFLFPAVASAKCVTGSGTCSDAFTAPNGTDLSAYDAAWVKLSGSSNIYTTGHSSVAIAGGNYAYYYYAASSSDTSQVSVSPSSTPNSYAREACVRLTPGLGGYCVGFGAVAGGNYNNCYVEKAGQYVGSASCGSVSAASSHSLGLVASGTAPVLFTIYLDGQNAGTVSDGNKPLTNVQSGFAIRGDGAPSDTEAAGWQDYLGLATTGPVAATTAPSNYACPSGSGSCFDTFSGSANAPLSLYNKDWLRTGGYGVAFLTGNKSIEISGSQYAFYYNRSSVSDTSSVVINPSKAANAYSRSACVRISAASSGYCVGFGNVTNGVYNNCPVAKSGQYLGNAACGSPSASVSHTLAITATGSSPVKLQVFLDGAPMGTVADTSRPYTATGSGFALIGDGSPSDSDAGTWQDFLSTGVATAPAAGAPTFSPGSGTYPLLQSITMTSATPGAAIYYTLDGSIPGVTSKQYTGPLALTASATVKAITVASGGAQSSVASAAYTLTTLMVSAPAFSLASPYSGGNTTLMLSDATSGASILYCQDTSNTCIPSLTYGSGIAFFASGYIRSQAAVGSITSPVASWQGTWTQAHITTTSCPEGTQYQTYPGCTLQASGGVPPYTYNWSTSSNDGLVEGLTLNSSTGAISGKVYGQGIYSVPFTVTDGANTTVTQVVTMPMRADNSMGGCSLFPDDSVWHLNVSGLPVDNSPAAPISSSYINTSLHLIFGAYVADGGIPFLRVPYNQQMVPVSTTLYQSYFTSGPFPASAPIEGTLNAGVNDDRHVLILQTAGGGNGCKLWEMWQGASNGTSTSPSWTDSSNAYWDLNSYDMLPQDNGSTDAAGLPVAPLLYTYDEVAGSCAKGAECGVVKHAGRLTLNHTLSYHVWPATAQAGLGYCTGGYQDPDRLISQSNPPTYCSGSSPMGEIYRIKSGTPSPAACAGHPQAQVLITAMRNYGLIVADNGQTGGIVATADSRWDDNDLACLTSFKLTDFEPVDVSGKMKDVNSSQVH